jgi:hypothetical protein
MGIAFGLREPLVCHGLCGCSWNEATLAKRKDLMMDGVPERSMIRVNKAGNDVLQFQR